MSGKSRQPSRRQANLPSRQSRRLSPDNDRNRSSPDPVGSRERSTNQDPLCTHDAVISNHIYPNQSVLKEALKNHLEEKLPDFMRSMSSSQYTNRFHSEWCSANDFNNGGPSYNSSEMIMNDESEVRHPSDSRQNTPKSESREYRVSRTSSQGLSQEELDDLFGKISRTKNRYAVILYQLFLGCVSDVSLISGNDRNAPILGNDIDDNSTQTSQKIRNIKVIKLINPVMIYFIVLFGVIVYGSFRYSTTYIPFYQQNIESYAAHSLVKVGCVIGANNNDETKYYVYRTEELARNGSKFILWSEAITYINDTTQYNELEQGVKNISQTYNTYIGFTYLDASSSDGKRYNKLTVISPNGDILINYAKSNLVPFVENKGTAGPEILQTNVASDFGTIGGAICFDYNFPSLISQASKNNVGFMIQPSDTWGNYININSPIAGYHFRTNTLRSIENGFTLFRCCHYGFSGAWGPYGQTYVAVETVDDLIISFQIPLYKHVKTIYGVFGETWAWICLAFSAMVALALI
ncbi:carbon-nitrogen hydrolase [Gigaspora rosea]|uniref:Carbon-nitrogen hydrolase n=1 Tax=Gigaspora rosea TaxID=44941 RepID=A0A397TUZ3_9GLOM|nr:carbon-nitrogen hydrolase [Gigaspora rosea]